MRHQIPEDDDFIHVASACEMTGFEPTPVLTAADDWAYAALGIVPVPRVDGSRKIPASDPCLGDGAR